MNDMELNDDPVRTLLGTRPQAAKPAPSPATERSLAIAVGRGALMLRMRQGWREAAGAPGTGSNNKDRRRTRRCGGDEGAALVEFALLAPLLFALLLGTFTGGISLSRKNSMTNAVREGARLGATLVDSTTWAASVRARVDDIAGADLNSSQICVELAMKTSGGESTVRSLPTGSCPFAGEPVMPAGVQTGACVAKVWARRTSDLEAVFFSQTLTLEADAVARFERGGAAPCA